MRRVVVLLLIVSLGLVTLGAVSGTVDGDAPLPEGAEVAVRDFYRTQDVLWVHGDATDAAPEHEAMVELREAITDSGYEIVTASTTVDSLRTDPRTGALHAVVTTSWTLRGVETGELVKSSMTDEWQVVLEAAGPSARVVRTVFVSPPGPNTVRRRDG